MRIARLAIAGGVLGLLLTSIAAAQATGGPEAVRQPVSIQRTAFERENYLSFAPANDQNGASRSPSDRPAEPQVPALETEPAAATNGAGGNGDGNGDQRWQLPQPRFLANRDITLGGWTAAGLSINNHDPVPDYNGPVTFTDRAGRLFLNQQWFFLDKPINNDGCGWAWGGHVDFVYGSDAFLTQTYGLENPGHQDNYYQVALPQMYFDLAYNDLTVRFGHFYTIIGYEVVQAPQNFFYSHSYLHTYGEPFSHTGMLFMYKMDDNFSFSAGMHRGDDQWEARPGADHLGFLGGVKWTSPNKKLELALSMSTSELIVPDAHQQVFNVVGIYHFSEKLKYVFEGDVGQVANGYVVGGPKADWYGASQYLIYDINKCWAAGLRVEAFRDDSGVRVTGLRPQNPIAGASFPGDFWEISAGVNWKPHANFTMRPEVRWDWYDAAGDVPVLPYDNGHRASQFLVGCDFIVTY